MKGFTSWTGEARNDGIGHRSCVKGPRFGLTGFSITVVFTAKINYSEVKQSKISKGKKHMGQSLEETSHKLPRILSQYSHIACA